MNLGAFSALLDAVDSFVWGPALLVLLFGTGVYLMILLRFMPLLRIGAAFRLLWRGRHATNEPGDITPFQSLMTALSATIGVKSRPTMTPSDSDVSL